MLWLLLTFYYLWASFYLLDLEPCSKKVLANRTSILSLHHLVIFLILGKGSSKGVFSQPVSLVHCQEKQLSVQSSVWLGDPLHAAGVIRGAGNSTALRELEPQSFTELLHISSNHCTYRGRVNPGTHCGYLNPWQGNCDNLWVWWLCCG